VRSLDWDALKGRRAFVKPAGLDDAAGAVSQACLQRGMTLTDDIAAADVFIVANAISPSARIRLLAGAKGLLVMSAERVLHDRGPFLQLEKAVRLRRRLWATDAWQTKHAKLWAMVAAMARMRGSKWVVAPSLESFQAHALKRNTPKTECFLLDVAAGRDDDPAGVPPLGKDAFLTAIFVVNRAASCL
jgi:hypothetical protein